MTDPMMDAMARRTTAQSAPNSLLALTRTIAIKLALPHAVAHERLARLQVAIAGRDATKDMIAQKLTPDKDSAVANLFEAMVDVVLESGALDPTEYISDWCAGWRMSVFARAAAPM